MYTSHRIRYANIELSEVSNQLGSSGIRKSLEMHELKKENRQVHFGSISLTRVLAKKQTSGVCISNIFQRIEYKILGIPTELHSL
jgi:hypothetical protein